MLLQFSVTNHRSLRDKQTLSLVAADAGNPEWLIPCPAIRGVALPVVAIYGANASGKSNVVGAIRFMRDAVLDSHRAWHAAGPAPWEPFLLVDAPAPSTYEAHFVAEGTRYRYGFTLSGERIEEEWLHAWPNAKKQLWLERERDKFTFGPNLHGENKAIERLTRANSLFLSAAAQNNHVSLGPAYRFFASPELVVRTPATPRTQIPFITAELARLRVGADDIVLQVAAGNGELARLLRLLGASDTGINGILNSGAPKPHLLGAEGDIMLAHASATGAKLLPLHAESDGTLALLHLGLKLFKVLDAGGVFVIDELEGSLHPTLARRVVGIFQDPTTNPKRAQLVFTTHDTNLLGSVVGEPVLRRDQVWLTEKDEAGATTLYPLTDFHPRKEENLERGYLQGRYGAIPFLGALVSSDRSSEKR